LPKLKIREIGNLQNIRPVNPFHKLFSAENGGKAKKIIGYSGCPTAKAELNQEE
jgi:hypothetical protein